MKNGDFTAGIAGGMSLSVAALHALLVLWMLDIEDYIRMYIPCDHYWKYPMGRILLRGLREVYSKKYVRDHNKVHTACT